MEDNVLRAAMKITVSEPAPCVRELAVTVPAAVVDQALADQLRVAARHAQLPGFRPGKAPLALVRNHYNPLIGGEVRRQCHALALAKAVEDEKLDIVTYPVPPDKATELSAGQDLSFTLTVNVAPMFDLPPYRELKLQEPEIAVREEEVEKAMDRFREMHAEFAPVDEAAMAGDMLKLDFSSDLELPPNAPESLARYAAANGAWVWMNQPEILPGMVAGMLGARPGETRELDVVFPADFREAALAGRKGHYRITVSEIHRRKPVSDDAELCRRMQVADLSELRRGIREMFEREGRARRQAELRRQVLEQICAPLQEMPVPPAMLQEATGKEFRHMAREAIHKEDDVNQFLKDQDRHLAAARQNAATRIRQFFILREIARAEKIQVGEQDFNRYISEISRSTGMPEQKVRDRVAGDQDVLDDAQVDLLMDKVVNFLIEQAMGKSPAA